MRWLLSRFPSSILVAVRLVVRVVGLLLVADAGVRQLLLLLPSLPACLAGHDAFPGWLVGCLDPRMLPLLALPGCGLARLWRVGVCLGALAAAAAPEQQELPFFVADGKMQR